MAITRSELQAQIYEILGKTPSAYGLLTPAKVNQVIQDSLDYTASHMLKIGGGWLQRTVFLSTVAGTPYIPLPTGLMIINSVKSIQGGGNDYYPLAYNDGSINVTPVIPAVGGTVPVSTVAGLNTYSFSSGQLFVQPTPNVALANSIRIDGVFFPAKLTNDGSNIGGDLDNPCFVNYIKWRTASILFSLGNNNAQTPPSWTRTENEWAQMVMALVARRFREPTFSRAFSDY